MVKIKEETIWKEAKTKTDNRSDKFQVISDKLRIFCIWQNKNNIKKEVSVLI